MKRLLLATVSALAVTPCASAQTPERNDALEQEIRRIEMRDAEVVLRGDFAAMERTWAEDFAVNSPNNQVTRGKDAVLKLIRAGNIGTYATFVRDVESVTIYENVAIVMGWKP